MVELLDEKIGLEDGALLEDRDGRYVGQGTGGDDVCVTERAFAGPEQVETPMVKPRRRMGTAWTDWKPALMAAGGNMGQSRPTAARFRFSPGSPER